MKKWRLTPENDQLYFYAKIKIHMEISNISLITILYTLIWIFRYQKFWKKMQNHIFSSKNMRLLFFDVYYCFYIIMIISWQINNNILFLSMYILCSMIFLIY